MEKKPERLSGVKYKKPPKKPKLTASALAWEKYDLKKTLWIKNCNELNTIQRKKLSLIKKHT